VDAAKLFKEHSGKYYWELQAAGMFDPKIIAAYGRMGWCLTQYDGDKLVAVIVGYPVGTADYVQLGDYVGVNEEGEYFFNWACITHPEHRGDPIGTYKRLIQTKWPKVKYAYGYRKYRKTRLFKER
jgi:hypothetical protein